MRHAATSLAATAALLGACVDEEQTENSYVEQAASNYVDGSQADPSQAHCASADNVPIFPDDEQNILDAIARYEAQTPLDFVQLAGPISHNGHAVLVFTGWNEDYGYGTPPDVTGNAG